MEVMELPKHNLKPFNSFFFSLNVKDLSIHFGQLGILKQHADSYIYIIDLQTKNILWSLPLILATLVRLDRHPIRMDPVSSSEIS